MEGSILFNLSVILIVVKKVLTDMLELWAWSNNAGWHTITDKKARGKERWFLMEEVLDFSYQLVWEGMLVGCNELLSES